MPKCGVKIIFFSLGRTNHLFHWRQTLIETFTFYKEICLFLRAFAKFKKLCLCLATTKDVNDWTLNCKMFWRKKSYAYFLIDLKQCVLLLMPFFFYYTSPFNYYGPNAALGGCDVSKPIYFITFTRGPSMLFVYNFFFAN